MSETELENEIQEYKQQIEQIDLVLVSSSSSVDTSEFQTLKTDLEQLLKLTQDRLVEVKKNKLLKELDLLTGVESNPDDCQPCSSNNQLASNDKPSSKSSNNESDDDIVGSKCRVFFNCTNTDIKMHNALILGIDSSKENTVRVIFCNPTQMNMKICDHFMNDTCKFNDECKYSHGYQVNVEDLHSYLEPNYHNIKVGKSCLAKHTDDLWHLATIESIDENHLGVQFKKFNLNKALAWEDVYPLDDPHEYEDEDDDDDETSDEEVVREFAREEFVYKKPTVLSEFGEWEKHTRGIGSKLMAKMGYIIGKGLGKSGEGRVDPVEVIVLPEGNISLDRVMELKEKKLLKKRKFNIKNENQKDQKEETDVFEFINHTLLTKYKKDEQTVSPSTSEALNQANTKGLNIKMLETHNRMQDVDKEISKLRQSLIRNKNSDKATQDQIKQRLNEQESLMNKLKKAESDILNEKNNRKRKSDIF